MVARDFLIPDTVDGPPEAAARRTRQAIDRIRLILNSLLRAGEIVPGTPFWSLNVRNIVTRGGSQGLPGRDGNRLITGEGPPEPQEGHLGDLYFDAAFCAFWLKTEDIPFLPSWVHIADVGSPGPRGKDGRDGATGPAGAAGPTGPTRTPVGAELQRSTNQSINSATDTVVTFPTRISDDGSLTTGGTPWNRLIVQTSGWHLMTANLRWEASGGGFRAIWFLKNGSLTTGPVGSAGNATTVTDVAISACWQSYLAASDYIQVNAYQDSGGALNVTGATFSMVRR